MHQLLYICSLENTTNACTDMATMGSRGRTSSVPENGHRNEFSWDQLEEDEHGRLRASVCIIVLVLLS